MIIELLAGLSAFLIVGLIYAAVIFSIFWFIAKIWSVVNESN